MEPRKRRISKSGKPSVPRYEQRKRMKNKAERERDVLSPEGADFTEMRLNRFIANAGVCSRRDADELIKKGLIRVNGKVVTEMGTKVKPSDKVQYKGKTLSREHLVYVLLNKPKGFITTTSDPRERKTVMHLVEKAGSERLYPVGRLDKNTTGLLLLTNDGELSKKLTHPSHRVEKVYQVETDRPVSMEDLEKMAEGLQLEDGFARPDDVVVLDKTRKVIGIGLHVGRNRIVRRMFEHLGYEVKKLDRVLFAGLTKKDLPRGKWRFLSAREVIWLKHMR